jgi:hypothetical protein
MLSLGGGLEDRVARIFNVDLEIRDSAAVEPDEQVVDALPGTRYQLVQRPFTPRAYAAGARSVASTESALQQLREDPAEATRVALLQGAGPSIDSGHTSPGDVRITRYEADEVHLRATVDHPAALVLNDLFDPGWKATVDGQPSPVYAANVAVRAVVVGSGSHDVVFRYAIPYFKQALVVLVLGLFGVGLCLRAPRVEPRASLTL